MLLLATIVSFILRCKAHGTVELPGLGRLRCNLGADGVIEALGVPYAQPPTGRNRFRPPQPLSDGENQEVDATEFGPACLQARDHHDYPMSEDCLNLNIWAPTAGESPKPVFFWIHGGAFRTGTGRDYNLSHMAQQGIVTVSINYRLGGFGFLTSDEIRKENPASPTNGGVNGLLDQVQALKWVKQNIGAFGGDPSKITIAGESAGSLSVCIHLHMPISQGLFSQAILESGSCLGPWQDVNTAAFATKDSRASMEALNTTSLAGLRAVEAQKAQAVFEKAKMQGPTPDGFFMPENPSKLPALFKNGQVIVGSNTMDTLYAPPYFSSLPDMKFTVSLYKSLVRGFFGEDGLTLYPVPADAGANAVAQAFYSISSDVCNTCPKHWIAQKLLAANNAVYTYHFGYGHTPSFGLACHGCEMPDALQLPVGSHVWDFYNSSYDSSLAASMSSAWVSFSKSGTPQPSEVTWPRSTVDIWKSPFLNVSTLADGTPKVSVDYGLAAQQCSFFDGYVTASSAMKAAYMDFCIDPFKHHTDNVESNIVLV